MIGRTVPALLLPISSAPANERPWLEGGDVEPVALPREEIGDLAVFHDTGACGASMSSNYNSRPLIPEVTVEGDRAGLIRGRQTVGELLALEVGLPENVFSRDR
ncbi:hypothetical protein [Kitasatospora aureofaciens]|uniref:hypothetical protein n=1 Tax=Kitasatospora aureofaciens TaxID=1894 RepID=UPI00382ECA54